MIWMIVTAYDFQANVNVFPTMDAMFTQLRSEFPPVHGETTLLDCYITTMEYNDSFHDLAIRVADPLTGRQVNLDPKVVMDADSSAHALLALQQDAKEKLAKNGTKLFFP
jgi:hypothetical protein